MIPLERRPAPGVVPRYEWREGDRLARIGATPIRDILDFYYLGEDQGDLELVIVDAQDKPSRYHIKSGQLSILGESFAPMEFKTCAAQCIFCFIDQNPAGMRDNIYVKDEDYRLSFLYGNYITLTSMGKRGIRRIIEQRLTPLYVSVHATDVDVRTELLGIKRRIDVIAILRELTDSGITVHAQIVLCPGFNDGEILERSLEDLGALYPGVASIAVVPVGLSDHREGLAELAPVTAQDATAAIDQVTAWGDRFLAREGTRLGFVSDEFFLKAGRAFPSLQFYEDLPQEDNGIGQARALLEEIRDAREDLVVAGQGSRTISLLTGTLAAAFFEEQLAPLLVGIAWLELRFVGITNRLYGSGITVAGLLPGRDFLDAIEALPADAGTVLIPDTPINHDGLFLDDLSLDELQSQASHPVHVARDGLVEALLSLAAQA